MIRMWQYRGAGVCITNNKSVFLGLRSEKPYIDRWSFPGGGREKCDGSELDNAFRETFEETGIDMRELSEKMHYLGKKTLNFIFFVWTVFFYRTNLDFENTAPDEFYYLKWINIEDIMEGRIKSHPFMKSEIRHLKKLLKNEKYI